MITLYSTNCAKCKILKKKLDGKGIEYSENGDVDKMISLGFTEVPVHEVENERYGFADAIKWVDSYGE